MPDVSILFRRGFSVEDPVSVVFLSEVSAVFGFFTRLHDHNPAGSAGAGLCVMKPKIEIEGERVQVHFTSPSQSLFPEYIYTDNISPVR